MKKYIPILIIVALIGIVVGGLIMKSKITAGATGPSFHLESEYVGDTPASGRTSTTTATAIATTTPIYFTANSTSTISFLTAGVSDLRLNITSHSTTTAEGSGPNMTVEMALKGNNGVDEYFQTALTASGVAQLASIISTYNWNASATTTRVTTLSPEPDNFASASIQITNLNAPRTVLRIGSTAEADVHLEIIKVVPNQ